MPNSKRLITAPIFRLCWSTRDRVSYSFVWNLAYERATGLSAAAVVGKPLFVAFPDNPDDAVANGVANLYTSLRRVADKGIEDVMPPQRYDVRGGDGVWRQRWWLPVNRPIRDSAGRLLYLLHTVQAHEP